MSKISFFFQDAKPFVKLMMLIAIFMFITSLYSFASYFFSFNAYISQSIAQILMFGLSVIIWGYMFEGNPISFIKTKGRNLRYYLIISFLLVFILLPFIDGISIWNNSWSFEGDEALRKMEENSKLITSSLLSVNSISMLFVNLLVFALIPAFLEEYFFRGAMQKTIIAMFRNEFFGILLTSIIFSLAHFQFFSSIPRVLLGMILGYLYVYSKNIFIPILFHFLNNSIGIISVYLYYNSFVDKDYTQNGEIYSPWLFIISLTLICIFFAIEIRKRRKSRIFVENLK